MSSFRRDSYPCPPPVRQFRPVTNLRHAFGRRTSIAAAATFALVTLLASSGLVAQTPPPYVQVIEHEIEPSKFQEYAPAMKGIQAVLSAHDYPLRATQAWNSRSSVAVTWVFPLQSMADLDRANAAAAKLRAKGDPRVAKAFTAMSDTLQSSTTTLLRFRGDLSYQAREPWVPAAERDFLRLEYAYVKPGMAPAFEESLKAWRKAVEKRGSGQGYLVFEQVAGVSGPLFVVGSSSRSQADHATESQRVDDLLGAELPGLVNDLLQTIRKYEVRYAELNRELSPSSSSTGAGRASQP